MHCLSEQDITAKAQGHELSNVSEEHLAECQSCQAVVAEESHAFVLSQASQEPVRHEPDFSRSPLGYRARVAT